MASLDCIVSITCSSSFQPHRGWFSSVCQQPGSPGWPQQDWTCRILIQLFLRRSHNFFGHGMSTLRFVKKDRGFGLSIMIHFNHLNPNCPKNWFGEKTGRCPWFPYCATNGENIYNGNKCKDGKPNRDCYLYTGNWYVPVFRPEGPKMAEGWKYIPCLRVSTTTKD